MADIELVIKIDEDIAHGIKNGENDEPRNIVRGFQATIADAIKNGKPLDLEGLKSDMVAMLTEIQLEIEEKQFLESSCSFMDKTEEKNYAVYTDDISKVIQQKIDALKMN